MPDTRSCRYGILVAVCLCAQPVAAQDSVGVAPTGTDIPATQSKEEIAGMIQEANRHLADGDIDEALSETDAALQIDPHNASLFELRGSIYIQEQLWDRAAADYKSALAISPDTTAFKYDLAEIQFLQRAFDNARPGFAALEQDAGLGDLATYKVFLCDLFGGHEDIALRDLQAINKAGDNLSYYYANAVWDLTHRKPREADKWVESAQRIYTAEQVDPYVSSLNSTSSLHPAILTFTAKTGEEFDQAKAFLEEDGLRIQGPKGWMTLPLSQLPDDLSSFPAEMQRRIAIKRTAASDNASGSALLSFTTRQGTYYNQVKAALGDNGLQVLTPDGWLTIPFSQLPQDLSSFPATWQKQIEAGRNSQSGSVAANPSLLNFHTKNGKHYQQVKGSIDDVGVHVLTPDGWITVPFAQLPDDLSSFPAAWRYQIMAARKLAGTPGASFDSLSFTTRKGTHYDHIRGTIDDEGLHVLTTDGWIVVPFTELTNDLSPFPPEWGQQITARRKPADGEADSDVVTFTTRQGVQYDHVQAALGDDGLQVLTPQGWIIVPFGQLPKNLSMFSPEMRKEILARHGSEDAAEFSDRSSFTTRHGTHYTQVRAMLEDDGLMVLTADGWITVPLAQLPDDLSGFPPRLREEIKSALPAAKVPATTPLTKQPSKT